MNNDLISKQDAIDVLEKQLDYLWSLNKDENPLAEDKWYGVNWARNTIADLPSAERPQGVWLVTAEDNHGVHRICCPFCSYEKGSNNTDTIIVTFHKFPKFCENCGAELKGGVE